MHLGFAQHECAKRSMQSFKEIHEAGTYFKEIKQIGSKCLLTGGPATHPSRDRYKQVREGFRQSGVLVTVEGEYGKRTVTLRGFTRRNPEVKGVYTRSRRQSDAYTISVVIDKLDTIGATTYVEGNQHHVRRQLRKHFGLYSCSVNRHSNGVGYTVTRLK